MFLPFSLGPNDSDCKSISQPINSLRKDGSLDFFRDTASLLNILRVTSRAKGLSCTVELDSDNAKKSWKYTFKTPEIKAIFALLVAQVTGSNPPGI